MTPAPDYPRITEALRRSIASGEFAPGSTTPSEAALATRFGVARNTLSRALAELEQQGLITAVPGRGRIVCDPNVPASVARDVLVGYRRIVGELRAQIEGGTYSPRGRLPSEVALAKRYGVSRETVRHALAHLRLAGLVSVAQGKGWFVRRDEALICETSQDVPSSVSDEAD